MTMGEFDPNIPVGEPGGFEPSGYFSPGPSPAGGFSPPLPVGEPGGFQPTQHFTPPPMPMSAAEFNPNAAYTGQHPKESFGQEPARLGVRGAARTIDGVICLVIAWIVTPQLPYSTATASYGNADTDAATSIAGDVTYLFNVVLMSLFLGVVAFLYFMIFESALGWTPGKKLLGLSVHASSRPGAPKPTPVQAAKRNKFLLLLAIPIPFLSYLFLVVATGKIAFGILNSSNGRGKHDLRADTEVLKGQPLS